MKKDFCKFLKDCNIKLRSYQKILVDKLFDNQKTLIYTPRQSGTSLVPTLYLLFCAMNKECVIGVNSHNKRSGEIILNNIKNLIDTLPEKYDIFNTYTSNQITLKNGSKIINTSVYTIKGMNLDYFFMDNAGFGDHRKSLYDNIIPQLKDIKIIVAQTSLHHNKLIDILLKDKSFVRFTNQWYDIPRKENFKEDTINIMGEKRWKNEFELKI